MLAENIRKLAKSHKYQVLFNRAKDISGIQLFNNKTEFSYIQILFLHWLNIYNTLFMDLLRKEEYITEDVINDPIRVDAYLIYRSKVQSKKETSKDYITKKKEKVQAPGIPKILFTPKRDK